MTSTRPHAVTGFLRARPERADEIADLLLSVVDAARAEAGCLEFHVHRAVDDPDLLVMYEVWRSADDLARHLEQPYMTALTEALADRLEKDVEVCALHLLSQQPRE